MLITTKSGGRARGAVNYVLKDREASPKILRGSPDLTIMIDENKSEKITKHTAHTVISFKPGEVITEKQKQNLLDDFERNVLGNMKDRLNYLAVEHTEKDHYHIHIIINCVDLKTGDAFNPYPYRESNKKLIMLFSQIQNEKFGFAQVEKDLNKTKFSSDERKALKNIEHGFKNLKTKDDLDKLLQTVVKNGIAKNRPELINYLEKKGFVLHRKDGEKSISLKIDGKNIRLEGGIYAKNDNKNYEVTKKEYEEFKQKQPPFNIEKAVKEINQIIKARDTYNRTRFKDLPDTKEVFNKLVKNRLSKLPQTHQNELQAKNNVRVKEHSSHPEKTAQKPVKQASDLLPSVKNLDRPSSSSDESREDPIHSTLGGNESMSAQMSVNNARTALVNAKTPKQIAKALLQLALAQMNLDRVLASIEQRKTKIKI